MSESGGGMDGRIIALLRHAGSVLGLRLCYHDHTRRLSLPVAWTSHRAPHCAAFKQTHGQEICMRHDQTDTFVALAAQPEGRIHVCPAGFTEIAAPVMAEGLQAGVLFAGQCWCGEGALPAETLIVPPSREWLRERQTLLVAVAGRLGALLRGERRYQAPDRRTRILAHLDDAMERAVTLEEVAGLLSLSVSRTSHLIRETFGMTFPQLVREVKLREGALLLASTDGTVGEIARQVGIADPNYFARCFSRRYGMSPTAYRKRHPAEA